MRYIRFSYVVGLFLGATLFVSCAKELELQPEDDLLSTKQVQEAGDAFDDRASSSVDGMYAELKIYAKFGSRQRHSDFGLPSISLMLDERTDNMWSNCGDYDWYSPALDYSGFRPNYFITNQFYTCFYNFIGAANKIILASKEDSKSEAVQNARAQAKAFRAWSYLNLVQGYQYTYVDNKDKLAVPLVTETMTQKDFINNPRVTVETIYKYIVTNLEQAKETLTGKGHAKSNALIDEFVVYGLLARTYLVMQEYAKAAEAAKYVIEKSGLTPYNLEEASRPGLSDIADHNVLWGIPVTSRDEEIIAIAGWGSFVGFLSGAQCYADFVPRCINPALYESMGENDVRRALWISTIPQKRLDGLVNYYKVYKGQSDGEAMTSAEAFLENKQIDTLTYASVKFGPADNNIDLEENSADYIMMRIEEMHYIYAEAIGETEGKAYLENFIKTNRDEEYEFPSDVNFFDEIYRQRRLEFWGEMLSYYDMMRFKKKMLRSDSKKFETKTIQYYPKGTRFDLEPDAPEMLFVFPRREVLQNPAIVDNTLGTTQDDTF